MKNLTTALVLLITLVSLNSHAQGYFALSGQNKGLGLQAGALIKQHVDIGAGYITRLSSNPEKPTMCYAQVGKRFKLSETESRMITLTPSIGISTTSYTTFGAISQTTGHQMTETDSTHIYFHLELGFDYRKIRPFVSVSRSVFTYYGAGVKIFIVLREDDDYSPTQRRSF